MNKKWFWTIAFSLMVAFVFSGAALAATKTSNLGITASVAASCSIQTVTDIAFGAYDPTSATDTDNAGSMQFRCVKSTSYKTYITGARSMTGGGDTLNFELYNEAGRTTLFPNDNSGTGTSSANNSTVTKDIFGRIAAQQDVGVASYTATLVATVEY